MVAVLRRTHTSANEKIKMSCLLVFSYYRNDGLIVRSATKMTNYIIAAATNLKIQLVVFFVYFSKIITLE